MSGEDDLTTVSMVPAFVRELLVGDRLERAEEDFRLLVGVRDVGCVASVEIDIEHGVSASLELLLAETIVGGPNDPTQKGSERPWFSLIGKMLGQNVDGGGLAAREWYRALIKSSMLADVPVMNQALAAYVAGIIEAHLGNDVRAERWLATGHGEAELDQDVWTPLFTACRFVRGALREAGR